MSTKPARKPRLANVLAAYHDRADALRDGLRRELLPLYRDGDPVAAQIGDTADYLVTLLDVLNGVVVKSEELANLLKIERIISDGYTRPEDR